MTTTISRELLDRAEKASSSELAVAAGLFAIAEAIRQAADQIGYNSTGDTPGGLEKLAMDLPAAIHEIGSQLSQIAGALDDIRAVSVEAVDAHS